MTMLEHAAHPWVNGKTVDHAATFAVLNPATGETVAQVADGDATLIDTAITAAAVAFPAWSSTPAEERASKLRAWADLITDHTDDIAKVASAESGKLFREARGEVGAGVAAIRWSADMAEQIGREDLPSPTPGRVHYTTKEPIGVVACITPWNFQSRPCSSRWVRPSPRAAPSS